MFTWTHVGAAWMIGRRLPGGKNNLVPLACACGAVVPDLALMGQIAANWARGLPGDDHVSPMNDLIGQITHSLLVWPVVGIVLLILLCHRARFDRVMKLCAATAFLVGVLGAHIFIDMLTHKNVPMIGPDYVWPFAVHLAPIFGIWTYRLAANVFMPRWPELVIDIVLAIWIGRIELCSNLFFQPEISDERFRSLAPEEEW